MQFGLTDEQEMIVSTVRSFVEHEIYPHEAAVERAGAVPPDLAQQIKRKCQELGFYACNFPQEVGGAGLTHLDFTLVERELGRGSMALTHFFGRPQNILMACVKEGGNRQDLHEAIREHSMEAAKVMKEKGGDNDLLERIAKDSSFKAVHSTLKDIVDPKLYVGRSPQQAAEFVESEVEPVLKKYAEILGQKKEVTLKV